MSTPLVSCLCVTEQRAAFMPWLWWNYAKQTHPSTELVVVDSNKTPWAPAGWGLNDRVVHMPPGTNIPQKRNRALAEARGDFVVWFDDDDWHHPRHIELVYAALGDAWCAGPKAAWWINLPILKCKRASAAKRPQFNGSIFQRAKLNVQFDESRRKASDIHWMRGLIEKNGQGKIFENNDLVAWLNHTQNISNPTGKHDCRSPLSVLREAVGAADWGGTDQQLLELRKRLGLHGAA